MGLASFIRLGLIPVGNAQCQCTSFLFLVFRCLLLFSSVYVLLKVQQSQEEGEPPAYQFWRSENDLCNNGTGSPTRETKMIKSAFRPSDDPTTFAYHIPKASGGGG
mmetsp:Transcript_9598/g.18013  ORF Transcript_9598/g.18013 Transcript_9598/m.18013 type:complete len:106 (+) Transcript_9598:61-378(+)